MTGPLADTVALVTGASSGIGEATVLALAAEGAAVAMTARRADRRHGVADLVNLSSVAGRFPRSGSAAYNATKFGVNGFSEGLRQEVTGRHLRVSVIEPGATATELAGHNRPEVQAGMMERFGHIDRLEA